MAIGLASDGLVSALQEMRKTDARRSIQDALYLVSTLDLQQGRVPLLCVGYARQTVKNAKRADGEAATL